jgi:hypothetical protein
VLVQAQEGIRHALWTGQRTSGASAGSAIEVDARMELGTIVVWVQTTRRTFRASVQRVQTRVRAPLRVVASEFGISNRIAHRNISPSYTLTSGTPGPSQFNPLGERFMLTLPRGIV